MIELLILFYNCIPTRSRDLGVLCTLFTGRWSPQNNLRE
jgi:hypothetical protein